MPKYKHGSGTLYQQTKIGANGKKRILKTWWLSYYDADGRRVRESTKTTDAAEARSKLNERLGEIAKGEYTGPAADRITVKELIDGVLTDYQVKGKKDVRCARIKATKHLAPFFAGKTAHGLKTADVKGFIKKRQGEGASNGEINRELALLKRAFNLAIQEEKITRKPHIPRLEEDNVRQGFFEPWQFDALLPKLPDYLKPALTFAFYTGWRVQSEILPLTWDRVDLDAHTVMLYRGTTKNKRGRLIKLPQVLFDILDRQWQDHLAQHPECPFVFHKNGKRMLSFYKAWKRACQEAGLSGKLSHDFRRTAVRNLVRAGVPERVAMMITGHKTRDVFERYNIVSDGDLEEAARKIDERIAQEAARKQDKARVLNTIALSQPEANGHTFGHTSTLPQGEQPLSH